MAGWWDLAAGHDAPARDAGDHGVSVFTGLGYGVVHGNRGGENCPPALRGGRRGTGRGHVRHRGFTEAERLFGEARTLAEQDVDRESEALAVGGLGMTHHHRNLARLVAGLAVADADVAAEEELMRHALNRLVMVSCQQGRLRRLPHPQRLVTRPSATSIRRFVATAPSIRRSCVTSSSVPG